MSKEKEKFTCSYKYFNPITDTSINSKFIRETEKGIKLSLSLLRNLAFEDMTIDDSTYKEEYIICQGDMIEEVYKDDRM